MSQPAAAIHDQPPARMLSGLRDARVGLAIGLVALGLLFHAEVAAAVNTWIEFDRLQSLLPGDPDRGISDLGPAGLAAWTDCGSTANRCRPGAAARCGVAGGRAAWHYGRAPTRRHEHGRGAVPRHAWPALVAGVVRPLCSICIFWCRSAISLPRQLQDFTTWFTRHGLDILGIPAYIDGYVIEIPQGTFFVAEACAGLRFLIASIAFGVLYALLIYRSPVRRMVFIAAS